jgi:hypothetical protein
MNKYYLIVPAVLLAAFFGYERHFQRQHLAREKAQAAAIAAARAEQDEIRQKQIASARHDADLRTAEREKQERDKAERKKRDHESLIATLQAQADEHATESAKLNATIQEMAVQVDVMRTKQLALEREALELTRQLELKQADLRKAELDVQLTTGAVASRLAETL